MVSSGPAVQHTKYTQIAKTKLPAFFWLCGSRVEKKPQENKPSFF